MPELRHDGATLAYEVTGDGPPALLVQGVGVVGEGWRPQVQGLADRYRLLVWDHRGIGGSARGDGPITIARLAGDARALMDAVGWDRAHVAGHSMGGLVAQQLAVDHPERVRSLALLCTFVEGRRGAWPGWWVILQGLRGRLGTRRMRRRAFLELVLPPEGWPGRDPDAVAEALAPLFGHDLADQPPIVMAQVRAMAAHDLRPRLGALAGCPTLVVSATHDRLAPPTQGRALASAIPGARYVELAGAHGVPIQGAAEVNALLEAHWAGA